jgi:ribosomal protein L7/L12
MTGSVWGTIALCLGILAILAFAVSLVVTLVSRRRLLTILSEPGSYRVILQVPGDHPVAVIAVMHRILGLDVQEAQAIADRAPAIALDHRSREAAQLAVEHIEDAGGRAVAVPSAPRA